MWHKAAATAVVAFAKTLRVLHFSLING